MIVASLILVTPSMGRAASLLESHFDANEEGFTYSDDTFDGTNEPGLATGSYEVAGGQAGGGLRVYLPCSFHREMSCLTPLYTPFSFVF